MRGLLRLSVRVARSSPLSLSTRRKRRRRNRGLAGGKGPGVGLFAAQQLYVTGERQFLVRHSVAGGPLVKEPAHRVMCQHPAVELLAHQVGGLAAQYAATLEQVGLQLVEHRLDLPTLVV